MAGVDFRQTSVICFAGDLAVVCIIGVSVIAGCPQGEISLYTQLYDESKECVANTIIEYSFYSSK